MRIEIADKPGLFKLITNPPADVNEQLSLNFLESQREQLKLEGKKVPPLPSSLVIGGADRIVLPHPYGFARFYIGRAEGGNSYWVNIELNTFFYGSVSPLEGQNLTNENYLLFEEYVRDPHTAFRNAGKFMKDTYKKNWVATSSLGIGYIINSETSEPLISITDAYNPPCYTRDIWMGSSGTKRRKIKGIGEFLSDLSFLEQVANKYIEGSLSNSKEYKKLVKENPDLVIPLGAI